MKTIFTFITTAVLIYFSINWIADNPQAMNTIRRLVNTGVVKGSEATSTAFKEIKESASQSLDK